MHVSNLFGFHVASRSLVRFGNMLMPREALMRLLHELLKLDAPKEPHLDVHLWALHCA